MHITQFSYLPQTSVCCVLCQVLSFHWWVVLVLLVCQSEFEVPSPSLIVGPTPLSGRIVGVIIVN